MEYHSSYRAGCSVEIICCHVVSQLEYLDGLDLLKHANELATFLEFDNASHGSVVAASDKGTVDPNGGHRGTTERLTHDGANGFAVGILVELHDGVFCTKPVEDLLGFHAKGSRSEGAERKLCEQLF